MRPGGFRFPSVAPGVYEVTATLASFAPQKFADVAVGLGQIKRLEFALALAGVAETVSVTAEIADRRREAERAPDQHPRRAGRAAAARTRLHTLVTQAPGANQEAKLGGLSIDGASAGENRYIIDGIETTNLQSGMSGKNLIADFVDEVQVKSSGYTAEFGGATGRRDQRGHQERHEQLPRHGALQLPGQLEPRRQRASDAAHEPRRTRRKPSTSRIRRTTATRIEPGFALGGPIAANRAWFFGAYQPALTDDRSRRRRRQAAESGGDANRDDQKRTGAVPHRQRRRRRSATTCACASPSTTAGASGGPAAVAERHRPGRHATTARRRRSRTGRCPATSTGSPRRSCSSASRGGYYSRDQHDTQRHRSAAIPVDDDQQRRHGRRPGRTCSMARDSRASLATSRSTRDQQTRAFFQADGTVYAQRRRRAPDQVRRADRPHRQQRAERRSRQPRDLPLGHARSRAACP